MTTTAHTFTGKFTSDSLMSARCSCGAQLKHVTGGQQIAATPVRPAWARFWFASHVNAL
jgi:hypothetical protein